MSFHRPKHCLLLMLATTLTAAQSGGDPPSSVRDLMAILQRAGPVPVISQELTANQDGLRRLVVPGKCQEAGETELSALVKATELEEAFAFVPSRCVWVEIGVDETASSVRIERGIVDALVSAHGSVVVYHTHVQRSDGTLSYLPAYADLLGVVLINSRYLADLRIQILHRAVTPLGTFEISFRPSEPGQTILQTIFETGLARFAGENLVLSYAGPEREGEYYSAIRACPALAEALPRIGSCFPMQAGDFLLAYRRHPELQELSAAPLLR